MDSNANNNGYHHTNTAANMNNLFLSVPQVPSPSSSLASSSIAPKADLTTTDDDNQTQDDDDFATSPYSNYYESNLRIPNEEQDLASLYKQIDETWQRQRLEQQQQQQQQQQLRNSNSLDLIAAKAELKDIPRSRLRRLEKLGEGQFGEIHLCSLQAELEGEEDTIVAVKELRRDSNQAAKYLNASHNANRSLIFDVFFFSGWISRLRRWC